MPLQIGSSFYFKLERVLQFCKGRVELSQMKELLPFVVDTSRMLFLFCHVELERETAVVETLTQEQGEAGFYVCYHPLDFLILQGEGNGTCLFVDQRWLHNTHALGDGRFGLWHGVDEGLPLDKQFIAVDRAMFFGG